MKKLLLIPALALGLSGCSMIWNAQESQGSLISPAVFDQLKVGQTIEQVIYLLGSPNIVENNGQTWIYMSRVVKGQEVKSQLIYQLNFNKGILKSFVKK